METYLQRAAEKAKAASKEPEPEKKQEPEEEPEMIHGICFTNLDSHKGEFWPTTFFSVPFPGDRIESQNGKTLEVVQITHSKGVGEDSLKPLIKIELGKS